VVQGCFVPAAGPYSGHVRWPPFPAQRTVDDGQPARQPATRKTGPDHDGWVNGWSDYPRRPGSFKALLGAISYWCNHQNGQRARFNYRQTEAFFAAACVGTKTAGRYAAPATGRGSIRPEVGEQAFFGRRPGVKAAREKIPSSGAIINRRTGLRLRFSMPICLGTCRGAGHDRYFGSEGGPTRDKAGCGSRQPSRRAYSAV